MIRAVTLALLLALPSGAADARFELPGILTLRYPQGWVARDSWRPPAPAVVFLTIEPAGEFRLVVYKYSAGNPLGMTHERFLAELEQSHAASRKTERVAKKEFTVYKGIEASPSPWETPHHDPDEALLGPSGGDLSQGGRLARCRARGAWDKYDWYREAHGKKEEMDLFLKYFTDEDALLVELCLGPEALRHIRSGLKPDPSIRPPTEAEQEGARKPADPPAGRVESVSVVAGTDGFFVIRYDSPPGAHPRHYGAFLRLLSTFKPVR